MNLHPLIVHFPIALLVVYAVLEIVRLRVITRQAWYEPVKSVLLAVGVISAFFALGSGETAEHLVGRSQLIEVHSLFAGVSTWIFGIIFAAYLIRTLATSLSVSRIRMLVEKLGPIWRLLVVLSHFLLRPFVAALLAFVGLIAITCTGALGGAIVYGPDADPIVSFIYHLFF